MVPPRPVGGQKSGNRLERSDDTSSRLSQRLRNRFSLCFRSLSPSPSTPRRKSSRVRDGESLELIEACKRRPTIDNTSPRLSKNCRGPSEEIQLDLNTLQYSAPNFRALLLECKKLRKRHKQLSSELHRLERRTVDISERCYTIISENNRQLHFVLQASQEMDREVEDLRQQLIQRDQIIRELRKDGKQQTEYSSTVKTETIS